MLRNLLIPFQRDLKRDFASGTREELLGSKVRQVLLTEGASEVSSGELPWRTAFGSKLNLLRHRNNDETLKELARVWIRDALKSWLPEVSLTSVSVVTDENKMIIRIRVSEGDVAAGVDVPVAS